MSLTELEDNLIKASATLSLSSDYSATVVLANQGGQFYAGCYDTCVPLVYQFPTTQTYGSDITGTPDADLYSTTPSWIAGLIGTYDEYQDTTTDQLTVQLSSYYFRLNQIPLTTEIFSSSIPDLIDTILDTYLGVPSALVTNNLTSTFTLSTRVDGESAWEELKQLAQAAGGTMYVQAGGNIEFGDWKDQNSSVDHVIPPEWTIYVSKKSVGPQNTYLINGTGANTAVASSGYKVLTDSRTADNTNGFGSVPGNYNTRVISGIGNKTPEIQVANISANEKDLLNVELVSDDINLYTQTVLGDGLTRIKARKKDGTFVSDELINLGLTGQIRPTKEATPEWLKAYENAINQVHNRIATGQAHQEAVNDRAKKMEANTVKRISEMVNPPAAPPKVEQKIEEENKLARKFEIKKVAKPPIVPLGNLIGGPAGGAGQKNIRQLPLQRPILNPGSNPTTAVTASLKDNNQTGECGWTVETISNKYADSPEKLTRILKRRYQELFLDNATMSLTVPYIADIRLNDVITFTTMGTSEIERREVTALVVGIQVDYSAPHDLTMNLTVQDFSCLDGTRDLISGNLIAARNGGYQSVDPYFTIGNASSTEFVNFQDLTLTIAQSGAGTPQCTYNHADASVGDEYIFDCYVQKIYPITGIHPLGSGAGIIQPITYTNSQTGSQGILNTGTRTYFSETWTCTGSSFTIQFSLGVCADPVGFVVDGWRLRKICNI